jgi:Ser/Thr protein kinase RdoA (MazF antagonist)
VDTRSGEKWVLRITAPEGGHDLDHVAAEMDWLAALARDTTLSVPRPLAARDGKLVVESNAEGMPGPRLCEIFAWVPGSDLADHLSLLNMNRLGELSARLHAHARQYQPPAGLQLLSFDRFYPFPEPFVLFEPAYVGSFTQSQRKIYQQGVDRAQAAIDRLKASREPMRILHGDLHPWNVRCFRGVLSPIDFEDLMWGWPVQDIGTSLYYLQDRPDFSEIRTAFETGYRRVSPWPERNPGEIDAFIIARGLGLVNFVIQNEDFLVGKLQEFPGKIENRLRKLMSGQEMVSFYRSGLSSR